jgi:hypothetical protein
MTERKVPSRPPANPKTHEETARMPWNKPTMAIASVPGVTKKGNNLGDGSVGAACSS